MTKKSESYQTIAVVVTILIVGLSAVGAWFYINLNKGNTVEDRNSYKYKQSQIDECMIHAPTFTDQPTLEANYQKKVEYCTQLTR